MKRAIRQDIKWYSTGSISPQRIFKFVLNDKVEVLRAQCLMVVHSECHASLGMYISQVYFKSVRLRRIACERNESASGSFLPDAQVTL